MNFKNRNKILFLNLRNHWVRLVKKDLLLKIIHTMKLKVYKVEKIQYHQWKIQNKNLN